MKGKSRKVGKAVAVFCGSIMFLVASGTMCFGDESTSNALDKVWGKPIAVTQTATGAENRFYDMPASYKSMGVSYRYFVLQNGTVIKDGITNDLDEKMNVKKALMSVPEQMLALSKIYYEKYPTSIADIEKAWGTPIDLRKLNNGMEERHYRNFTHDGANYQTFYCKDGRVIAQGLTFSSTSKITGDPTNLKGLSPLNVYRGTESSYH